MSENGLSRHGFFCVYFLTDSLFVLSISLESIESGKFNSEPNFAMFQLLNVVLDLGNLKRNLYRM